MLFINKFLLGNWILRSTNDNQLQKGYTFLIINNNNTIKLKTILDKNLIVSKKSTTGLINNITNISSNSATFNIIYTNYNVYSHSLCGIQLPEIKSFNKNVNIKKHFKVELLDQSLLVSDTKTPLYYLFDLQIGKFKSPYIEISLYTFLFTQIVSIFINIIMSQI